LTQALLYFLRDYLKMEKYGRGKWRVGEACRRPQRIYPENTRGGSEAVEAEQVSKKMKLWRKDLIDLYERFRDAFDEAGILKEFISIVDNVDSTLIIVERYKSLPPVLMRTFIYDSISRLDDFVRGYRGYAGKAMDYVGEELRSHLNRVLEETNPFGGE
jgi:hypothetical protein